MANNNSSYQYPRLQYTFMEVTTLNSYILYLKLEKPSWYYTLTVTTSILAYMVSSFIIIGNGFTIYAIYKYKYLQNKTNALVCSLSVSDIMVGLLTIASRACGENGNTVNGLTILIILIMLTISFTISILHLLAVAIERYVAILHPFGYVTYMTNRVITLILTLTWLPPTLFWTMIFIWHEYIGRIYWISFIGPVAYMITGFIIVVLYARILNVVHKQASQIRNLSQDVSDKKSFKSEIKATKTLAMIVFAYVVFWSPWCIKQIIEGLNIIDPHIILSVEFTAMSSISMLLGILNSGVNSIIYAWFSKDFRKAYINILLCGKRQRNIIHVEESTIVG